MAATEYEEYVNLYPNSPDAVYAKYQTSLCYYNQVSKPGRDQANTILAVKALENMIKLYPDTKEAEDAKLKLQKARDILGAHYFGIGVSNYKIGALIGAVARFKQVIDEYPEFKQNDKLFFYTGKSYYRMRGYEAAISFFQKVINSYPRSKYLKKSKELLKKASEYIAAHPKKDIPEPPKEKGGETKKDN
jgi:outer membrane protein assembly factor BamD